MTSVTDSQIEETVVYIQSVIDQHMSTNFPTLTRKVVSVSKGKKYAKFIVTDTGRYAYGFLDMTNGDLLKAASWKAPALNFPRGNIHTKDLKCCGICSIG